MKERPTTENVANIKEELRQLLVNQGVKKNTENLTQVKSKLKQMNHNQFYLSEAAMTHMNVNSFVHAYKNMLSLSNFPQERQSNESKNLKIVKK